MKIKEINELLKKAFQQECYLEDDLKSFYTLKFPCVSSIIEFEQVKDNCEKFLSQYDIKIGASTILYSKEVSKNFVLQINKLPLEKFLEKLNALKNDISLHEAANKGNIERVKRLLDDGANVNSKNILGDTPMQVVDRMGHKDAIDILLDHGADTLYKDEGAEVGIKTNQHKSKSNPVEALLYSLNQSVREGEELVKLIADKPVNPAVVEGATGGTEGMQGSQRLENSIRFFSPATRIHTANSTEADEQPPAKKSAVAYSGK